MPRLALLANPDSGSGEADEVERLLGERGSEVTRLGLDEAERATAERFDRIVVAGGDGSIGCAAEAAAAEALPLAVIAVGTANDFARVLGLPSDLEDACELAATGSRTRRLELGRMNGRPFVNVASAGLSPAAARKAHGLKGALGPLAYAVGALRAGATAKPVSCTVNCDGELLFSGEAWQLTVACTGAFGGGSGVDADPADGMLDAVIVPAGSRARLVSRAYGLRLGRIEAQRGVESCRGHAIEVRTESSDLASGFNVDGEIVEETAASFTVDADAFEVVLG